MCQKYTSLSDQELVKQCLLDIDQAWDEFFSRFTNLIKRMIIRTLVSKNLHKLASNNEIVQDIYLEVVNSVWWEKKIETLKEPSKCKDWLETVTRNKTLDWLSTFNRKKNLARKQGEEAFLSLSSPLNKDGTLTLGDTIPDPEPPIPTTTEILDELLKEMGNLEPRELWALRLKVLFYDPPSEEEIAELSGLIQRSVEEVLSALDALMEKLLERNSKREDNSDSAGRVYSIILNLQNRRLIKLKNSNLSESERQQIDEDIEKRSKRLQFLRKSASSFVEPSNEEIAALLGISPDKAQQVSVLVHRARKELKARVSPVEFQGSHGNNPKNSSSIKIKGRSWTEKTS